MTVHIITDKTVGELSSGIVLVYGLSVLIEMHETREFTP